MAAKSADISMVNADEESIEEITIPVIPPQKPDMTLPSELLGRSSLFSKTESLLSQLKESNEKLVDEMKRNGPKSVLVEVTDPEKSSTSYVDMEIWTGVLEEKRPKSQQEQIKSTTDKLLGINKGPKKSIIIEESDSNVNVQTVDKEKENDTEDTCDEDIDL